MTTLAALGARYSAWERTDKADFQRRARILQSMWREERGYEMGAYRGRRLGSRLAMPWARESLANYLTETVKAVVREEVIERPEDSGKLFGEPRIFDDLLSSQPLCFNLFGEMKRDLRLTSAVLGGMTGGRVPQVTRMEFEHSPGRGDRRYLGDRSAFDVYLEYTTSGGGRGFVGIEVKYHEDLKGRASLHRPRYEKVAQEMGCFRDPAAPKLRAQPLQQLWRDHLLAGSLRAVDGFDDGLFVLLYPERNQACAEAVAEYGTCLANHETFAAWTMEATLAEIRRHTTSSWVDAFGDRYLVFDKVRAAEQGP